MKLTLDRMCITSGRLCSSCQEKYDQKEISDLDIEIGSVLLNVAKSQRVLSTIKVNNIIETAETIYLIIDQGDMEKIEQAGNHLIDKLQKVKNKRYRFIEKTNQTKKLLVKLLDPVKPVSSSIIIVPPDSQKELKVKIKEEEKDKLPIDSIELSKLTQQILGMNAHYTYV